VLNGDPARPVAADFRYCERYCMCIEMVG
jgi:hypothetical protein